MREMLMYIKRIFSIFFSGIQNDKDAIKKLNSQINVYKKYNKQMKRWIMISQENESICSYLKRNNYNNIAIYGMGDIGQLLYRECMAYGINIKYTIDKYANCKACNVPIFFLKSGLEEVDCIVLTVYTGDVGLKTQIENVTGYKVIMFEEILDAITSKMFL